MALKRSCFCLSPRQGTLFFLSIFLIESVLMVMTFGHIFAKSPEKEDEHSKRSLHVDQDRAVVLEVRALVQYANAFIALMSVIFIAAIIYVLYNKPAITLLSAVIALLLLEMIFKTYAEYRYTFYDYEYKSDIQLSCIRMMFRILFTLYGCMVIHGFTIELKNKAAHPVNFINPQCPTQAPQYTCMSSKEFTG